MKTTLYYRDAKSDKVYSAWLMPSGWNFNVVCEYGRRGGTMANCIKTPDALPREAAQKVLDRLIAEKKSKGYTEETNGKPFDGDATKLAEVLPHPNKIIVTLDQARQWSKEEFLIQRKMDGELDKFAVAGAEIICEWMKRKSGGFYTATDEAMFAKFPNGWRAAFTVAAVHGENILHKSTRERWEILASFASQMPEDMMIVGQITVPSALTKEEGYVAHAWNAPWGNMLCCKVLNQWPCRVGQIGNTQSVLISDANTGEPRGRCKLGGGKVDRVRVGSIIKVEGLGLTEKGLIREPRVCQDSPDSWLVMF